MKPIEMIDEEISKWRRSPFQFKLDHRNKLHEIELIACIVLPFPTTRGQGIPLLGPGLSKRKVQRILSPIPALELQNAAVKSSVIKMSES